MKDVFLFLFSPAEVSTRLKERPVWLWAFIIVSVIAIITAFMTISVSKSFVDQGGMGDLPQDQLNKGAQMVSLMSYVMIVITPLTLFAKWAFTAFIVYLIGIILSGETRFKILFSFMAHSNLIIVLSGILNMLVIYLRGIDSVKDPLDMNAIGLNIFFPSESISKAVYLALGSINLFEVWYVIALTIGLSIIYGCGKGKAAVMAVVYWLITTSFPIASAVLTGNMFGV